MVDPPPNDEPPTGKKPAPILPATDERMKVTMVKAPHPAVLPGQQLLQQCELRTQRRSGPGGQHRNKTSSGAFLLHTASEIVAEATERRSQPQNRSVALQRLRYRLAIQLRTPSVFDRARCSDRKRDT